MTLLERPGVVISPLPDSYVSTHSCAAIEFDASTNYLAQFDFCLRQAGSFVIADSIHTLEANTHALALDSDRTDELIGLVNAFDTEGSQNDIYLRQCNLLGAMIRMSLDQAHPQMHVPHELFTILAEITATATKEITGPRKVLSSFYETASQIAHLNLMEACTSNESLVNVSKFCEQLKKAFERNSLDSRAAAFGRHFVGRDYANF